MFAVGPSGQPGRLDPSEWRVGEAGHRPHVRLWRWPLYNTRPPGRGGLVLSDVPSSIDHEDVGSGVRLWSVRSMHRQIIRLSFEEVAICFAEVAAIVNDAQVEDRDPILG